MNIKSNKAFLLLGLLTLLPTTDFGKTREIPILNLTDHKVSNITCIKGLHHSVGGPIALAPHGTKVVKFWYIDIFKHDIHHADPTINCRALVHTKNKIVPIETHNLRFTNRYGLSFMIVKCGKDDFRFHRTGQTCSSF